MSRAAPRAEPLGAAPGVRVTRFVCAAGPRDRPFEEQHSAFSLAVVLSGCFCYRCRGVTHAMAPGSVLLGEPDEPFSCSHEHGVGDVCLCVALSEDRFASVAAACAAPGRPFAAPSLPPLARVSALARALAAGADGPACEELALDLAGAVLSALRDRAEGPSPPRPPSAVDRRRGRAAARGRSRRRRRQGGGGHAQAGFQRLDQLRQFEHRNRLDPVHEFRHLAFQFHFIAHGIDLLILVF